MLGDDAVRDRRLAVGVAAAEDGVVTLRVSPQKFLASLDPLTLRLFSRLRQQQDSALQVGRGEVAVRYSGSFSSSDKQHQQAASFQPQLVPVSSCCCAVHRSTCLLPCRRPSLPLLPLPQQLWAKVPNNNNSSRSSTQQTPNGWPCCRTYLPGTSPAHSLGLARARPQTHPHSSSTALRGSPRKQQAGAAGRRTAPPAAACGQQGSSTSSSTAAAHRARSLLQGGRAGREAGAVMQVLAG